MRAVLDKENDFVYLGKSMLPLVVQYATVKLHPNCSLKYDVEQNQKCCDKSHLTTGKVLKYWILISR